MWVGRLDSLTARVLTAAHQLLLLTYDTKIKKSPKSIIIGRHSAPAASLCPLRYSLAHHLAGRRHALRPALRPREPLRAGAARRAHPDDVLNIFQEPLAGTQKFHHTLSPPLTRAHLSSRPSTRHRIRLSRTRKRHAHTTRQPHSPCNHQACACATLQRATPCSVRPIYSQPPPSVTNRLRT